MRRADIQIAMTRECGGWPEEGALTAIASGVTRAACKQLELKARQPSELSLVFADNETVQALNSQWRGKNYATNVLSFPVMPLKPGDPLPPLLGDVILAFETVEQEAAQETKSFGHHTAHLLLHGFLHLLGYDHATDADAEMMEGLETRILASLAIPDPYAVIDNPS